MLEVRGPTAWNPKGRAPSPLGWGACAYGDRLLQISRSTGADSRGEVQEIRGRSIAKATNGWWVENMQVMQTKHPE